MSDHTELYRQVDEVLRRRQQWKTRELVALIAAVVCLVLGFVLGPIMGDWRAAYGPAVWASLALLGADSARRRSDPAVSR